MTQDPNILLVVLDTVRAKNCGLYGHHNRTTPYLSSLAQEATMFEQARAPGINTIASHASIFSGYHVYQHRITAHNSYLKPELSIWHELAEEHGYDTGLFSPNLVLAEASNLSEPFGTVVGPKRQTADRLFDDSLSPAEFATDVGYREYLDAAVSHDNPARSILNGIYTKLSAGPGSHDPSKESADVYIDTLLDWIDDTDGQWAACLNLMDAHSPYVPSAEHDHWGGDLLQDLRDEIPHDPLSAEFLRGRPWGQLRALEGLYDGCIRQLDRGIERLVDELRQRDALDDTLLVVTSDHGEAFGERSRLAPDTRLLLHAYGINEVLTHVPLIVRPPSGGESRRITAPASLTQFPEVIRETLWGSSAVDAFVPEDGVVHSWTDRVAPPGAELPVDDDEKSKYFGPWCASYREEEGAVFKYMMRDDARMKLFVRDAQTSYVVPTNDYDLVERSYEQMEHVSAKVGNESDREFDAETEQRLQELGYLQ